MKKRLQQLALRTAETRPIRSLLRMIDRVAVARQNVLSVVTYHRVDQPRNAKNWYPGLISATPDDFKNQIEWLSQTGTIVSMSQVLAAVRLDEPLPPRSILITFDDATRDFLEHAWPVLSANGLPSTVFVPTSFPDQPQRCFWWDRLHNALWNGNLQPVAGPSGQLRLDSDSQRRLAYRSLRDQIKSLEHVRAMELVDQLCNQLEAPSFESDVLGWEELRDLARQGVTLAAHTQTHPLLSRISLEQARAEILGSIEDLQREIGEALPVFAFPGGDYVPEVVPLLRELQVELAFTVERGMNDLGCSNPLLLKRMNVGQGTTPSVLHGQLLWGWYRT